MPKARTIIEIAQLVNVLVPTFSGDRSQNIDIEFNKFLDACNNVSDRITYAEQKDALILIKNKLEGDAYQKVCPC